MKSIRLTMFVLAIMLFSNLFSTAQSAAPTNAAVPPLIPFSNVATDEGGSSLSGVVRITFSLYSLQRGGEPLWSETQSNIPLDATGHYSVQLGITKPNGVSTDLFTSGEARWLGVRIAEQPEQARVLLLSVPYALKAGDAATIGGLPPSAFVLAAPMNGGASMSEAASTRNATSDTALEVTTTGGAVNYVPLFTGTATVADSVLFQSGTGTTAKIGVNTATPVSTLDVKGGGTIRGILSLPTTGVATATAGKNSQALSLSASAYNSSTPAAVNQVFRWQAEAASNDTATPSGTLNLLFGEGTAVPNETGLHIASNGQITFAAGQSFPGVVQLDAANTFTGNQTVDGIFSASSNAFGVTGTATTTTGIGVGVAGTAATPSGYGVEGLNTATSSGVGVYGSSAAAAGYGVEGVNTSGNGTGVYGTAGHFGVQGIATASSNTVGVYGSGVDGLQGSGTLHGVYAAATGSGSMGVYGTSPSYGLYGVATATSGNSVGVFGAGIDGLQGSGSTYGVFAAGTGASATGVYGTTGTSSGYGVEGVNTSSSGGAGVYGSAARFGVYGLATGTSDTVGVFGSGVDGLQGGGTVNGVYANGGQYGVYALTPAGTAGTYGNIQAPSLLGAEGPWSLSTCTSGFCAAYNVNRQAGVWADTNYDGDFSGTYAPALLATADASAGAVILNNSNGAPTLYAYNFGSGGGSILAIPDVVRAGSPLGSCALTGSGDASCTGTLKSVVATVGGAGPEQVETYSVQSAENWFEDAGSARLINGTGHVDLESVFGQTVNTGVEYHVFLTPDGDCKGLYVSSKTASGFEVRELGGGASSIAFEYRIMAKRVGYENVRLTNVTDRFKRQEAQSKNIRPKRLSSGVQPSPGMPALP